MDIVVFLWFLKSILPYLQIYYLGGKINYISLAIFIAYYFSENHSINIKNNKLIASTIILYILYYYILLTDTSFPLHLWP